MNYKEPIQRANDSMRELNKINNEMKGKSRAEIRAVAQPVKDAMIKELMEAGLPDKIRDAYLRVLEVAYKYD
jgi:hypothetical protein